MDHTDLIGGPAGAGNPDSLPPCLPGRRPPSGGGDARRRPPLRGVPSRHEPHLNDNVFQRFDKQIINETDEDIHSLISQTQVEGAWPPSHPLPLPTWDGTQRQAYVTPTIWQYEELATTIELYVQRLLEDRNYDTVGNFLQLYHLYKDSGSDNLNDFYHRYGPAITSQHHTCVGLALELWCRLQKLESRFPGLTQRLFIVSCEECIDTVSDYTEIGDKLESISDTLEKEHVLLALKIDVSGRQGVLLCDPGYHVARVITVMKDKAYPHTGWFVQSEERNVTKKYNYSFNVTDANYIEWSDVEIRNGIQKMQTALVFVSRPYMTAVDVTERRNLVYDFRSLLSRDTKGHLVAGFYFKVKPNYKDFTLFYQNHGRQTVKMNFDMFTNTNEINEETSEVIRACNQQLGLPEHRLKNTLSELAALMSDVGYVGQLLDINNSIALITELN